MDDYRCFSHTRWPITSGPGDLSAQGGVSLKQNCTCEFGGARANNPSRPITGDRIPFGHRRFGTDHRRARRDRGKKLCLDVGPAGRGRQTVRRGGLIGTALPSPRRRPTGIQSLVSPTSRSTRRSRRTCVRHGQDFQARCFSSPRAAAVTASKKLPVVELTASCSPNEELFPRAVAFLIFYHAA